MRFIPCATSPSRSLLFSFRALLAVCVVAAMAIAAHAQTPPAPGGPTEGIKVHGHWTIDIRNADGTLASHHEFENALTASGQLALASLLSGFGQSRQWSIDLLDVSGGQHPCGNPQTGRQICAIHADPPTVSSSQNPLGVVETNHLLLSGTVTSFTGGTSILSGVWTMLDMCGRADPNCSLNNAAHYQFTSHSLASPITVAAGQIIQVTVDITFS